MAVKQVLEPALVMEQVQKVVDKRSNIKLESKQLQLFYFEDERNKIMKLTNTIMFTVLMLFSLLPASAQTEKSNSAVNTNKDGFMSVSGIITKVNHPYATLKDENGREYEIHLGPYWYWHREKFELKKNIKARVRGEVENVNGQYHFYPWEIAQDGKSISLADENGIPKWAGVKNKASRMQGKGQGRSNRWK
jgi:hypothetical protein